DVVLRRTGGVVRRCLFAVDRTPWEERATLRKLLRAAPGCVQHVVTETQLTPRHLWRGVGQEGKYENLRVPEIMAAVTRTGHPFGGHPRLLGTCGGLSHLEQIPANGLLQSRLTMHDD